MPLAPPLKVCDADQVLSRMLLGSPGNMSAQPVLLAVMSVLDRVLPPNENVKAETSPSTVSPAATICASMRLNCVAPVALLGVSSEEVRVNVPLAVLLPLSCCQAKLTELARAGLDATAAVVSATASGITIRGVFDARSAREVLLRSMLSPFPVPRAI